MHKLFIERIKLDTEDRTELLEIDEKVENEILNSIISHFITEKSARAEIEERWREYFNAYKMQPTLPVPHLEWQSENISPKFFYLVEQFASVIRRSLVQSGKFFSLSTLRPDANDIAVALERVVHYHLTKNSFLMEFEKAIKYGCLTGLILLWIDWDIEKEEVARRTRFVPKPIVKALNPLDVVLDPSELRRWIIRRYYVPTEYAKRMIELGIWKEFPLYENPPTESQDEIPSKVYYDFSAKKGQIEILEFHGNLLTSSQKEIFQNIKVKIANRRYVVQIEKLDFWHRDLPAVYTYLYQPLGGVYSLSLFDSIYPILRSYTSLMRLIEDSVLLSLGLTLEIDRTRIKEEVIDEIEKKGFMPFQVLLKDGSDEVVQVKTYGSFNPNVLPLLQLYNQEIQNATGITEFLMGQPTSKGRPTAKEVMIKTQMSGALLDSIAIRVENEIISKIIEKLLLLLIQYETTDNLQRILGEQFAVLENFFTSIEAREELAYLIKDEIVIKVDGITQTLHKKEQIEQLVEFLSFVLQTPAVNKINFDYFISRIAYLFGITSREIFIPEDEMKEQQQTQMQEMAQSIVPLLALAMQDKENFTSFILEMMKRGVPPPVISTALGILQGQIAQAQQGGEEE